MCKKIENRSALNIKLQIYREQITFVAHGILKKHKTLDEFKGMVFDDITSGLKWLKKGQKNELRLYVGEVVEECFLRYHGIKSKRSTDKIKQHPSKKKKKSKIRSTK